MGMTRRPEASGASSCRSRCRWSCRGVRLALVQVWATATIAALVAGPGLGRVITDGFFRTNYGQGMAGAVVVAVVALVLELAAAAAQRAVDPMPSGPSSDRDDALSVPSIYGDRGSAPGAERTRSHHRTRVARPRDTEG